MSHTTNPSAGITPETQALIESAIQASRTYSLTVSAPADGVLITGDGQASFLVPAHLNGLVLSSVKAVLSTVSSSGAPTFQVRRRRAGSDVDMLTTALSVDAGEYSSATAATPAVIDTSNDDVATGDLVIVDVDVAGTGAIGCHIECVFSEAA